MAKPIVVALKGKASSFAFSKLDRKKLYASRKRVVLDKDDASCIRAELTRDGSILYQSSMTSQGYFENNGRWVPNAELVGLDADGKPVEKKPSTLGDPQPLDGPIPPEDLLDVVVQTVYMLDPTDLDAELKTQVESGKIYRFNYNYRADYHMETGYLLANDEGWFAVVGEKAEPEWCELENPAVETFDEDDDAGLDLDFEMT
ncbi:hypothetical protein ACFL6C_01030 [Myxococcota bacterium]